MTEVIVVKKLKLKKESFFLTLEAPKERNLQEAVLLYNNPVRGREYLLELVTKEKGDRKLLLVSGSLSAMELEPGDWDVYLRTDEGEMLPVILKEQMRLKLLFGDYQIKAGKEFLFFPMGSRNHMLTFRYRGRQEYDGALMAVKENAAFFLYRLLKPFWDKKGIWLIYEKYAREAQDNGFYFFQYCMEHLPSEEKKHIYYLMDPKSEQWEKLQEYRDHVLPFMSLKHMIYLLAAKVYVASDSRAHSFAWEPKPNIIKREISRKKILFLQHGVTAFKRVDKNFGKNGSAPVTYFAVTSKFEQDIVTENFGYTRENVPILGFCRWDVLKNKAKKEKRNILIMPTWRSWLENQSEEVFCQSSYYKAYRSILENQELLSFLEDRGIKLVFHIHPKMQKYLKEFRNDHTGIEFVSQGSRQLNELLMECSMLITDYSSVSWDVYYMGKPVLFYQFDYDLYEKAHGSYLDMETALFGDRCLTEGELVEKIYEYAERGFQEKEIYGSMRKDCFAYTDRNNCKRTLEFLKSKGY